MAQIDNTRRHAALKASLLSRIESASAHGFSLSQFMESNAVRFERVYPAIMELEAERLIVRTRATQSIRTKNGVIEFPVLAPAFVVEPIVLPRASRPDADDMGDPMAMEYTYLEAM